jgi:hypothetical protein
LGIQFLREIVDLLVRLSFLVPVPLLEQTGESVAFSTGRGQILFAQFAPG